MCACYFTKVRIRSLLPVSMTSHCRSGDEPLVIPDTHVDWRFAKNVK
jgi:hypothetical protein